MHKWEQWDILKVKSVGAKEFHCISLQAQAYYFSWYRLRACLQGEFACSKPGCESTEHQLAMHLICHVDKTQ